MFKKLMCLATLGAALAPASAQTFWQFSYTGFMDFDTKQFEPQRSESGFFAGSDDNRNGVLEQSELTRFGWEQVVYIDANNSWNECVLMRCSLQNFSYDLRSGQLDFASEWMYRDDMAYSESRTVAGDMISFYGYLGNGQGSGYTWLWTDQTQFSITPAPVPEPANSPMILAGLGVLGLAARRRRLFRNRPWS